MSEIILPRHHGNSFNSGNGLDPAGVLEVEDAPVLEDHIRPT
ncbi:MAG: hypothetical protein PVG14_20110 [Anaerolineales bacterium]